MATPKPQPTRALEVVLPNDCNIPNPALYMGVVFAVQVREGNIVDCDVTAGYLNTIGLKAGDIMYLRPFIGLTVTGVEPGGQSFTVNIQHDPMAPTEPIGINAELYNGADDNQGCILYVGTGGNVYTITAGGDVTEYYNVPSGQIIPVQTLAITGGSAENIIALW